MLNDNLSETSFSVEIWVAGTSVREALARRDQVVRHMAQPSVRLIGAGFGRFFYDMWRITAGLDPLCDHGDMIADAEFHLKATSATDGVLATLTDSITADLEQTLGFPVAVCIANVGADDVPSEEVEDFNTQP